MPLIPRSNAAHRLLGETQGLNPLRDHLVSPNYYNNENNLVSTYHDSDTVPSIASIFSFNTHKNLLK